MAALFPQSPTQSGILELLVASRELSVPEIKKRLESEFDLKVSIKNLYRIISQLIDYQMLVRRRGMISLNLIWVTHLVHYSDLVRENYLTTNSAVKDLPLSLGENVTYSSDSLIGLDPIWNDTLLHLGRISAPNTFYAFNSHTWHPLAVKQTELQLYKGLKDVGINTVMLYGDNSFLDQMGLRMMKLSGIDVFSESASNLPSALQGEGLLVWAAGDYVIECTLPEALSKHFSFYFKAINSAEQFDVQMFSDIFKMRSRCSITLSHDPVKANYWRDVIGRVIRA